MLDLPELCERQNIGATYHFLRAHLDIYIIEKKKKRYKSKKAMLKNSISSILMELKNGAPSSSLFNTIDL